MADVVRLKSLLVELAAIDKSLIHPVHVSVNKCEFTAGHQPREISQGVRAQPPSDKAPGGSRVSCGVPELTPGLNPQPIVNVPVIEGDLGGSESSGIMNEFSEKRITFKY